MDEYRQAKDFAIMSLHESPLPKLSASPGERLPFFQALGVVIALLNQCKEYDEECVGSVISRITPLLQAGNVFIWLDDHHAPLGFAAWMGFASEQHKSLLATPNLKSLYSGDSPVSVSNESSQSSFIWLTDLVTPFSDPDLMMSMLKKHMHCMNPEAEVWVLPELTGRLKVESLIVSEADEDIEARRLR